MPEAPAYCHDPAPEAPKTFHLHDALTATVDENKHYHCGKLEFEDRKSYREFVANQLEIGGTPPNMDPGLAGGHWVLHPPQIENSETTLGRARAHVARC